MSALINILISFKSRHNYSFILEVGLWLLLSRGAIVGRFKIHNTVHLYFCTFL